MKVLGGECRSRDRAPGFAGERVMCPNAEESAPVDKRAGFLQICTLLTYCLIMCNFMKHGLQ